VLANQGLLDAYDLQSGDDVYRQRIPHSGSGFSASPVAADGRIYLSSEDGDIFVVRAGPSFELLGRYPMGEPLMATPALAGDTMYVRGERHLFAIGKT
jgi:outer membrane protein assembly factor BamB